MGRQMDHRLAHGVFELRNVSTWNCSTIRSPWALSCYKPASPHCFSRIFPIPCGTQVSMVNGSDISILCPGWGQMAALVSGEDLISPKRCHLALSTRQLSAQFSCCFLKKPGQGGDSMCLSLSPVHRWEVTGLPWPRGLEVLLDPPVQTGLGLVLWQLFGLTVRVIPL